MAKQRRGNREFVRGAATGFNLISGNRRIAKQDYRWTVLDAQIEVRDVEIRRKNRLQCAPIEIRRSRFSEIAADLGARVLDRHNANAVATSGENRGQAKMQNDVFGVKVDFGSGAFLARNVNAIDQDGPEQGRANFANVDL